jgi:hypothetical protein
MKHLALGVLVISACHQADYSANSSLRACPATTCDEGEICVQNYCVAATGGVRDVGGNAASDASIRNQDAGTVSSPDYTFSREPSVYADDGELWDGETLYPWVSCFPSCDWEPNWVAWGSGDDVSIVMTLGDTPQTVRSFGAYQVCNAWGFDCTPITVATFDGEGWINQGVLNFTEEETKHNPNGGETGSFGWARLQLQSPVSTTSVRFTFPGSFQWRAFSELEIGL